MREQTQFVAFYEQVDKRTPQFLNDFEGRLQGTKNADKKDSYRSRVNQ